MSIKRTVIIASLFKDISTFGRLAHGRAFRGGSATIHSRTQMGFLFILEHKGEQSLKDLADQFGMTSSAATQVVDELEEDGIVIRKEDKTDRRKIRVLLTAKGKKRLAEVKRKKFAEVGKILNILSDEELLQLRAIEQKIIGRLREDLEATNEKG